MRGAVEGVARPKLVQALRAFGQADLRADPLSPLPLELALADAVVASAPLPPTRSRTTAARGGRTADPRRPAAANADGVSGAPAGATRTAADGAGGRQGHHAASAAGSVAKDHRAHRRRRSRAMLGSKAPVIPPPARPAAATNGGGAPATPSAITASAQRRPEHDRCRELYAQMKPIGDKLDGCINGKCHAVSFEGGVLTLGFYRGLSTRERSRNIALAVRRGCDASTRGEGLDPLYHCGEAGGEAAQERARAARGRERTARRSYLAEQEC